MHGDEQKFVQLAFDTNWVSTLGENIIKLEESICEYLGCGYAVALSSGTSSLHLAMKLAGVKKGDIVFCSDLTFSATVNPVTYEGGHQLNLKKSARFAAVTAQFLLRTPLSRSAPHIKVFRQAHSAHITP